jgi:RNA polymerase sigma-70 factor (ECF subfamily)
MADAPETGREGFERRNLGAPMNAPEVDDWFAREILPLESALMQFLQHNWRNRNDIADLRQDVYARVFEAALKEIPEKPRQFLFTTARNLLIDRVRRSHVVPIEAVTDLDALSIAMDAPGPDRTTIARDELRRVQAALDRLPPRCREAVVLRRVEGLSRKEIALRMDIAEDTVTEHLIKGMRLLASTLYGDPADLRRST